MQTELFECRNCLHCGPVNIHGRCELCDSDVVMSQEVIAARSRFAQSKNLRGPELVRIFEIPAYLVGQMVGQA